VQGRAGDGWWGVVLDARDAPALAAFYAELLGWQVVGDDPEHMVVAAPSGVGYLAVRRDPAYVDPPWPPGPGPGAPTARLEVEVLDLEVAADEAQRLGARLSPHQGRASVRQMCDPAGHVFCLYREG
jgi:catechol 2,3-dioxygenase-like lactoylglutathione lyase family enzyme